MTWALEGAAGPDPWAQAGGSCGSEPGFDALSAVARQPGGGAAGDPAGPPGVSGVSGGAGCAPGEAVARERAPPPPQAPVELDLDLGAQLQLSAESGRAGGELRPPPLPGATLPDTSAGAFPDLGRRGSCGGGAGPGDGPGSPGPDISITGTPQPPATPPQQPAGAGTMGPPPGRRLRDSIEGFAHSGFVPPLVGGTTVAAAAATASLSPGKGEAHGTQALFSPTIRSKHDSPTRVKAPGAAGPGAGAGSGGGPKGGGRDSVFAVGSPVGPGRRDSVGFVVGSPMGPEGAPGSPAAAFAFPKSPVPETSPEFQWPSFEFFRGQRQRSPFDGGSSVAASQATDRATQGSFAGSGDGLASPHPPSRSLSCSGTPEGSEADFVFSPRGPGGRGGAGGGGSASASKGSPPPSLALGIPGDFGGTGFTPSPFALSLVGSPGSGSSGYLGSPTATSGGGTHRSSGAGADGGGSPLGLLGGALKAATSGSGPSEDWDDSDDSRSEECGGACRSPLGRDGSVNVSLAARGVVETRAAEPGLAGSGEAGVQDKTLGTDRSGGSAAATRAGRPGVLTALEGECGAVHGKSAPGTPNLAAGTTAAAQGREGAAVSALGREIAQHASRGAEQPAAAEAEEFRVLHLRVVRARGETGLLESRHFQPRAGLVVAGRYRLAGSLGSGAFSEAVEARDLQRGGCAVCLKIVKNSKDFFDQGLDEVRMLQLLNAADPDDSKGVVRLLDFFYFKEHLFIVTEMLKQNLYEVQRRGLWAPPQPSGSPPPTRVPPAGPPSGGMATGGTLLPPPPLPSPSYFTPPRIQAIARQMLSSLDFLHGLGVIHADLKPENILVADRRACRVKLIDLGSSCFITDRLSSYIQSRAYRAPEVIVGAPYDQRVDIWSLGCILAELCSGRVLFNSESVSGLLAQMAGLLGPFPEGLRLRGALSSDFFTQQGEIFRREPTTGAYYIYKSKKSSLRHRLQGADELFLDFCATLLAPDPRWRPSAEEALSHPWLQHNYAAA